MKTRDLQTQCQGNTTLHIFLIKQTYTLTLYLIYLYLPFTYPKLLSTNDLVS